MLPNSHLTPKHPQGPEEGLDYFYNFPCDIWPVIFQLKLFGRIESEWFTLSDLGKEKVILEHIAPMVMQPISWKNRNCSSVNTWETREQPISTLQRAKDLNSKKRKENSHFIQACFQNKELLFWRIQISKRWVKSQLLKVTVHFYREQVIAMVYTVTPEWYVSERFIYWWIRK